VYTLGDVHKLYTSQLIAVMVKAEKVKKHHEAGKEKQTIKRRKFSITNFTRIQKQKKIAVEAQFPISSRSIGVPCSQKRNKKRVITPERARQKQQF
jgi:hypothetical protein